MNGLRAFLHLVWKDLKIEFRGKQFLVASAAFGMLMLFVTGMALDAAPRLPVIWSAGLLWLNVFFTTAIALTRHDRKDEEFGANYALRLIPVDRSVLFYAKWLSTFLFVLLAEAVLVGAFFVVFNQPAPSVWWSFLLAVVGGTAGLTGTGTFLAGLAAKSSMRDLVLPLLLFPVEIPLFLAVVKITAGALAAPGSVPVVWVEVLCAYIVLALLLPWLLYESLTEV
jgi:heme exporter protein B